MRKLSKYVLLSVLAPVVAMAADGEIPIGDFLAQVLDAVRNFGGLTFALKLSSIVMLVLASMKVTMLRPFWDKLGNYKALAAPFLSLVAGVVALTVDGQLTLPGVFAYLFAGSGAIVMHELLDAVKAIPGIGGAYVAIIDFIQGLFLKKK